MPLMIHKAQVLFLIDSTGSMEPCIRRLSENIESFMSSLSSDREEVNWRARVVGFRDTETDSQKDWFVGLTAHPFVSNVAELKTQLAALRAQGGGVGSAEIPESGLDALWAVSHCADWAPIGSEHRIIVLLSDAPTKPRISDEVASPPLDHTNDALALMTHLAAEHFKVAIYAYECPHYAQMGTIANSEFTDVSAGGTIPPNSGLTTLDFKRVIEWLQKTATGVSNPAGAIAGAAGPAANPSVQAPSQGGPSLPPGQTGEITS